MTETTRRIDAPDVLVVGAGPVGLVTACQLARQGVAVTVVDLLDAPTTEGRAAVVHARTLEMLSSLEVREELESRGRHVRAMEVAHAPDPHPKVRVDFTGLRTRHPTLLDVAQSDTEAVLAERAATLGVVVRRGVTLRALEQDDDGVTVTLQSSAGQETVRVGWLVGTDGGHSTTRHLIGSRLEGSFHGQHFAMSDGDVETVLDRNVLRMFLHEEGLGMVFPLAGDRARIVFTVEDPGGDVLTRERMQAIVGERTAGQVTMRDTLWLSYFEVHHAQVPQYRCGRVLLAGDAAHIHSPAGGQGMNTGVQDAANLAWKLALVVRGGAAAELIDTYDQERHPVGAAVVRLTTQMTDVATATGPRAVLRDLVQFVVGQVPAAGQQAATRLAQLAVEYRDSPLSVQGVHPHHGVARAGDRVPDPVGPRLADGTAVAVEDLLARPGLLLIARSDDTSVAAELRAVLGGLGTVLRLTPRPGGPSEQDVLVDPDLALGRALGLDRGGMALVRPDGHLGLIDGTTDPGVLRRYLSDVLLVPTTVAS